MRGAAGARWPAPSRRRAGPIARPPGATTRRSRSGRARAWPTSRARAAVPSGSASFASGSVIPSVTATSSSPVERPKRRSRYRSPAENTERRPGGDVQRRRRPRAPDDRWHLPGERDRSALGVGIERKAHRADEQVGWPGRFQLGIEPGEQRARRHPGRHLGHERFELPGKRRGLRVVARHVTEEAQRPAVPPEEDARAIAARLVAVAAPDRDPRVVSTSVRRPIHVVAASALPCTDRAGRGDPSIGAPDGLVSIARTTCAAHIEPPHGLRGERDVNVATGPAPWHGNRSRQ